MPQNVRSLSFPKARGVHTMSTIRWNSSGSEIFEKCFNLSSTPPIHHVTVHSWQFCSACKQSIYFIDNVKLEKT